MLSFRQWKPWSCFVLFCSIANEFIIPPSATSSTLTQCVFVVVWGSECSSIGFKGLIELQHLVRSTWNRLLMTLLDLLHLLVLHLTVCRIYRLLRYHLHPDSELVQRDMSTLLRSSSWRLRSISSWRRQSNILQHIQSPARLFQRIHNCRQSVTVLSSPKDSFVFSTAKLTRPSFSVEIAALSWSAMSCCIRLVSLRPLRPAYFGAIYVCI